MKEVQWEGWDQYEQLQVWYNQEESGFANEQVELIARFLRLESAAAAYAQQRQIDAHATAANAERQCEQRHAAVLATAHSELELTKYACRSYQDQLKAAEETLKE